ncbi:MAG: alginate export family protein [Deltaproteobacteria bacterium]|nr:alginate export family protein [Deltaproteobacteria bacterium]
MNGIRSAIRFNRVAPLAVAAAFLLASAWVPRTAFAQPTEPSVKEAGTEETAVFDSGAAPRTRIPLAPGLSIGFRTELQYQREDNFDLEKAVPDDVRFFEPLVRVALSYSPRPMFTFLVDVEGARRFLDDEENKKHSESRLELKQAYLSVKEPIPGLTLQAGRIRFKDHREWLYDEELDGGRVFYTFSRFAAEASVTQKNNRDLLHGGGGEDITNFVVIGRYSPVDDVEIAAYGFVRRDRSVADESPWFLGIHSHGEPVKRLEYWLEAAMVRGRSGPRDIEGSGFDVGATYGFSAPLRPAVTLGYAFGSGDRDTTDGTDKSFRQTGLQENEGKLHGVRRVKYYGEMLDPELSNIHILTASVGIRPERNYSLDFLFHRYRQDEAFRRLTIAGRDTTQLDKSPNGVSKDLGNEYDLVVAYRNTPRTLTAKGTFGRFDPGSAFDDFRPKSRSYFTELKVAYDF